MGFYCCCRANTGFYDIYVLRQFNYGRNIIIFFTFNITVIGFFGEIYISKTLKNILDHKSEFKFLFRYDFWLFLCKNDYFSSKFRLTYVLVIPISLCQYFFFKISSINLANTHLEVTKIVFSKPVEFGKFFRITFQCDFYMFKMTIF